MTESKPRKPREEDIPGPSVAIFSGKGRSWRLREKRRKQREAAREE